MEMLGIHLQKIYEILWKPSDGSANQFEEIDGINFKSKFENFNSTNYFVLIESF